MKKRLVISKRGFEHLYRFPPRSVQAALRNERTVINHIKRYGPLLSGPAASSWTNAVERLEKKGIIVYRVSLHAYVLVSPPTKWLRVSFK